MDIILASQSPRRRALMEQMGLRFRVRVSNVDETVAVERHFFQKEPDGSLRETGYQPGLTAPQMVEELSRRKAGAVAALEGPEALIVAADTVVSVDGLPLGKPSSFREAEEMLSLLSGREHLVFTGVTVVRGERRTTFHQETAVRFRTLTAEEIAAYIRTGEPMDKAGAYGIQGRGALLVESIRGDYFNVMGLPVCRLGQTLREFGIDCLRETGA